VKATRAAIQSKIDAALGNKRDLNKLKNRKVSLIYDGFCFIFLSQASTKHSDFFLHLHHPQPNMYMMCTQLPLIFTGSYDRTKASNPHQT
jgi:hypothetical protein